MKTVFNGSMVAHVWAQQSQNEGRTSNGSFYFVGETIYSYGAHFPIARFIKSDLVLMNPDSYSNSTAKHQSHTRAAISCKTIAVPNLSPRSKKDHIENLDYLSGEMKEYIIKANRARTYTALYLNSARTTMEDYNYYLEAFKIGRSRKAYTELPDAGALVARAKLEAEKARKAEKRKAAKLLKESKIKLELWKAGGEAFINMRMLPVSLRVSGDNVETTQGAAFPIDHAIKAYRTIRALRGTPWKRNGGEIRLGYFHIDSINEAGDIIAGCHRVSGVEITRMGEVLLNR